MTDQHGPDLTDPDATYAESVRMARILFWVCLVAFPLLTLAAILTRLWFVGVLAVAALTGAVIAQFAPRYRNIDPPQDGEGSGGRVGPIPGGRLYHPADAQERDATAAEPGNGGPFGWFRSALGRRLPRRRGPGQG
jgi:hypothetical protein